MKLNKNKKIINSILLIRLSSMGDIVLTSALLRQIRSAYKNARIDFLLSQQYQEIFKFNPNISNIILYDKSDSFSEINKKKAELKKTLQNDKYDLIIDLHNNYRSRHFRYGLGKKVSKIKKKRLFKLCLVHLKKNILNRKLSIPEQYFHTGNFNNTLSDDGKGLEIFLENEEQKTERLKKRIAIAPGAFHFTKRWGADKYSELINLIKDNITKDNCACEIILLGGKADKNICKEILEKTNFYPKDFSGESSILRTAELLSTCDLLITNDTGLMHIAAARQVPTVAIFGSTVTDFGFSPYRVKHKILEVDLSCRPCTHIGRSKCPKKHFNCMNLISVESVFSAAKKLLFEEK